MKLDVFLELATPPWTNKSSVEAIRETVEIAKSAEAAGCDTLWLPEHHFLDGYSNSAAPDMILAAIAQATHSINLGFAIIPLPIHEPVRVAERLATLEALAPGRIRWGVGRGVTVTELMGFNVNPAESRSIFEARFEELRSIMTSSDVVRNGEKLSLRPQLPNDFPVGWLAAVSPESFTFAAENNLNVMTGPFKPWPFVKADLARFRNIAPQSKTSFALAVHCDVNHEHARQQAERGLVWVYRRLFEIARPILAGQVEGYEHYRKLGWTVPLLDKVLSVSVLESLGLAAVGSPDHVAKKLTKCADAGLDRVSLICGGGDLAPDEIGKSLSLIAGVWRHQHSPQARDAEAVPA
jgi:alkanesulfonate monooxygenase SsuD/methylene tetrahydromethanopterin reductase-like flavin-dependent oxidoreductase (luciferase family)